MTATTDHDDLKALEVDSGKLRGKQGNPQRIHYKANKANNQSLR